MGTQPCLSACPGHLLSCGRRGEHVSAACALTSAPTSASALPQGPPPTQPLLPVSFCTGRRFFSFLTAAFPWCNKWWPCSPSYGGRGGSPLESLSFTSFIQQIFLDYRVYTRYDAWCQGHSCEYNRQKSPPAWSLYPGVGPTLAQHSDLCALHMLFQCPQVPSSHHFPRPGRSSPEWGTSRSLPTYL